MVASSTRGSPPISSDSGTGSPHYQLPPGAPSVTKPNLPNDEPGGTLNIQVRSGHRAIGLQAAVGLTELFTT